MVPYESTFHVAALTARATPGPALTAFILPPTFPRDETAFSAEVGALGVGSRGYRSVAGQDPDLGVLAHVELDARDPGRFPSCRRAVDIDRARSASAFKKEARADSHGAQVEQEGMQRLRHVSVGFVK